MLGNYSHCREEERRPRVRTTEEQNVPMAALWWTLPSTNASKTDQRSTKQSVHCWCALPKSYLKKAQPTNAPQEAFIEGVEGTDGIGGIGVVAGIWFIRCIRHMGGMRSRASTFWSKGWSKVLCEQAQTKCSNMNLSWTQAIGHGYVCRRQPALPLLPEPNPC